MLQAGGTQPRLQGGWLHGMALGWRWDDADGETGFCGLAGIPENY